MTEPTVVSLDPQKYIQVKAAQEIFLVAGTASDEPVFVVIAGPIGVGKTTIRHKDYAAGYVNIDAEDANKAIDAFIADPEEQAIYLSVLGEELVARAIHERRNIVIEVLMDNVEPIKSIIESMTAIGYKVDIKVIHNTVEKSWENNQNRPKGSMSALYTQDLTMSWFTTYFAK